MANPIRLTKPLTVLGKQKLAEEHEWLRTKERPKVVNGITVAAAEGDRSENAEYIYGKKRLRELDKRLRYLHFLLKDVQIIDPMILSGNKVAFGSTVTVLTEDGVEKTWTIVGEGEAEFHENGISWQSPVGKALLGKLVGDVVVIKRPAGEAEYEITDLYFGTKHYLQT